MDAERLVGTRQSPTLDRPVPTPLLRDPPVARAPVLGAGALQDRSVPFVGDTPLAGPPEPPPPCKSERPAPLVAGVIRRGATGGETDTSAEHAASAPAPTVTTPLLGDTPVSTGSRPTGPDAPRAPNAPAPGTEADPAALRPPATHGWDAAPGDAGAPLVGKPPSPTAPSAAVESRNDLGPASFSPGNDHPGAEAQPAPAPRFVAPPVTERGTGGAPGNRPRLLPAVSPPPPPPRGAPDPEPVLVPDRVRRAVENATSVDLGHVDVVRGPDSARAGATLGAAAFVHAGVVHLPRNLGPLESEPARGILAHELVHVAQQRSHPGPLPSEESSAGHALERQAERIAAETAHDVPAPQTARVALPDLPPEIARVDHSGALVFSPPPPPAPPPATPVAASPAPLPAAPQSAPVQRKRVDDAPAKPDKPEPPQLDLDDLARRLYPRIRPYLRKELSLDRERAAMTLGTSR